MVGPVANTISPKDYGAPIDLMISKGTTDNNAFSHSAFQIPSRLSD
jgi:hypothetical protein